MGREHASMQFVAVAGLDAGAADRLVAGLLADPGSGIEAVNVATVALGQDGRLRIRGAGPTPASTIVSGLLGAAVGVLTAGPHWLRLGGGVPEHLAADAVAAGLAEQPLRDFGERLTTGRSAVIAVAPADVAAVVRRHLDRLGGPVMVQSIDAAIVERTGLSPAARYGPGDVDGDVLAARTAAWQ